MKVYVRTKDGYIGEIVEVGKHTLTMSINGVIRYVDIDNVNKTSPLIIELVEIGDYVNGYFIEANKGDYLETSDIDGEYSYLGHIEYRKIYERDIETIVTKEQFAKGEFIL